MNFLVLDTSSTYCSVALSNNGKLYSDTRIIPRQHNKYLLHMIEKVFIKALIDIKDIDFIAYGIGPGSFVGVRLAAAVSQGFAVALNIPIIGFSSMFALAKSVKSISHKVAVILDAKMNDFYLGLYNKETDNIIMENVYKLEEYSKDLYNDHELIGESISELQIKNNEYTIDVTNIINYVYNQYQKQKYNNILTQETFPIYFRGTNHWKNKK